MSANYRTIHWITGAGTLRLSLTLLGALSLTLLCVTPQGATAQEEAGLMSGEQLAIPEPTVEAKEKAQAQHQELQSANERLLAVESALLEELSEDGQPVEKVNRAPVEDDARGKPNFIEETAEESVEQPQAPASDVVNSEVPKTKKVNEALVKARLFSSATKEIADELESLQSKNTTLKKKMNRATGSLTELREDNKILGMRAIRAEQELANAQGEMKKMQNQLMLAETEVERLSRILEDRNRKALATYRKSGSAPAVEPVKAVEPESIDEEEVLSEMPATGMTTTVKPAAKGSEEMPIATVMVDKAHLRTGPGKDNSPMMSVSRGTRLVVEARLGDWYRVITPTGNRAWVASEVVAFGKDANSSPTRTVRIKGYDRGVEDEAFELISSTAR